LGAADLRLGTACRSRAEEIVRTDGPPGPVAPLLGVLSALCLALIAVEQIHPLALREPTLRAVIETVITLCSLAAGCLFGLSFRRRGELRDLLLAGALIQLGIINLASYVIPAAISVHSPDLLGAAPTLGELFMGVTILGGAWVGAVRQIGSGGISLGVAIAVCLAGAAVAELGALVLGSQIGADGGLSDHGIARTLEHPVGVAFALAATAFLTASAVHVARSARSEGTAFSLLAAVGLVMFAGARLNYLVLPAPGIGSVTVREGLRLVGYGLILAAALRQEAAIRREIAVDAAAEERRRIARDLHDGLAQDLAFIVAQSDRIASEKGDDHPVAVAARRALAVSRGAIADLSASETPSAMAALRQVADELGVRFDVRVSVEADNTELRREAREDVVRIVREAIVNAAHGQARNIVVSLTRADERFTLRVLDDGSGIGGELKTMPGFGLRAMRERAACLGGGLTARPARGGGTELEVVFP
jgi:signal transduction histidine kinase